MGMQRAGYVGVYRATLKFHADKLQKLHKYNNLFFPATVFVIEKCIKTQIIVINMINNLRDKVS